jgi:hypothetical protein
MKVKVYNLIILDESGSMQSIHKPAVDGLNETLQSIQSAQKAYKECQEHFVTVVFFNSNGIRTIMEDRPVSPNHQMMTLKMNKFNPSACTPLYDAMGISLSKLRYRLDKDQQSQVLVTVITDGYENASQEYSGKMIKNLVSELKDMGWVFAYIGANQDVDAVADSMSINNRMAFEANPKQSQRMFRVLGARNLEFCERVELKRCGAKIDLQENFFIEKTMIPKNPFSPEPDVTRIPEPTSPPQAPNDNTATPPPTPPKQPKKNPIGAKIRAFWKHIAYTDEEIVSIHEVRSERKGPPPNGHMSSADKLEKVKTDTNQQSTDD